MNKIAVVLEKFGKAVVVKEPGCVAGVRIVKGMAASALVPHLGPQEDPHHIRRLVRTVEHSGRHSRDHPSGTVGLAGRSTGNDVAEVAVASDDPKSVNDATIYLRRATTPFMLASVVAPAQKVPPVGEAS